MKTPIKNNIWPISRAVIEAGDIEPILIHVDPEQLTEHQIYGLYGQVRLRFPGFNNPVEIFCNPVARTFLRKLHARWPYAAYFCRLAPITLKSPQDQLLDLSTFMAMAFCHCDEITHCETAIGIGVQYNVGMLGKHIAELVGRASELADIVGIPPAEISKREDLISESVVSFFNCGTSVSQRKRP